MQKSALTQTRKSSPILKNEFVPFFTISRKLLNSMPSLLCWPCEDHSSQERAKKALRGPSAPERKKRGHLGGDRLVALGDEEQAPHDEARVRGGGGRAGGGLGEMAADRQNFGKMLLVFGCIGTDVCK